LAGKRAGAAHGGAKADKPKGYEPGYTLQEFPQCCRTFVFGDVQFIRYLPRASDFATDVVEHNAPPQLMLRASSSRAAALCASVAFFNQKAQGQNRAGGSGVPG